MVVEQDYSEFDRKVCYDSWEISVENLVARLLKVLKNSLALIWGLSEHKVYAAPIRFAELKAIWPRAFFPSYLSSSIIFGNPLY